MPSTAHKNTKKGKPKAFFNFGFTFLFLKHKQVFYALSNNDFAIIACAFTIRYFHNI